MPRVYTYRTRARTKHKDQGFYTCSKCGQDILPGQSRYEWSFRYGGTYRRHVDCGYPRQSELTQSKMGEVYAAQEAVEDLFGGWTDVSELESALQEAADTVDSVASEYDDAAQNFGGQGENADRASELQSYASDLQRVSLPEREEDEEEDVWRDRVESEVSDALGQCPY